MNIPIEEYFEYHPPLTQERKDKHNRINELSLTFAKAVDELVEDEQYKSFAFFAIQQARMFSNQGITVDEIKQNYAN